MFVRTKEEMWSRPRTKYHRFDGMFARGRMIDRYALTVASSGGQWVTRTL